MQAPDCPTPAAKPPLRVLIIGVRDYDQPWAPTAQGALHDAIGWWRYAVLHLGADPAEVRVLTSPVLTATELATIGVRPDSNQAAEILALAEATPRALASGVNASEGIDWLLSHPEQKLLTFSGHGIANPALVEKLGRRPAPRDFWLGFADHRLGPRDDYSPGSAGGAGRGLVSLSRLRGEAIARAEQTDRLAIERDLADAIRTQGGTTAPPITTALDELTVVIDACFSTPIVSDALPTTSGHGPLHEAMAEAGRGLFACDVNESCFTIQPNDLHRGAWSWALQTVLSRWQVGVHADSGYVYSSLSHDELKHRARSLLDVMGAPQRPVVTGDRRVDQLAFLAPSALLEAGSLKLALPEPNVPLPRLQVVPIPGRPRWRLDVDVVDLETGDIDTTTVAWMLNTTTTIMAGNVEYLPGTEYWQVNRLALAQIRDHWNNPGKSCALHIKALLPIANDALKQWITDTFVPAFANNAQLYTTPTEMSFDAGATTPSQSTVNAPPYLCGWQVGPLGVDRGLQLVLNTTVTPPKLVQQRWFYGSNQAPTSTTWIIGAGDASGRSLPRVASYPTYGSGTFSPKWYTHIG